VLHTPLSYVHRELNAWAVEVVATDSSGDSDTPSQSAASQAAAGSSSSSSSTAGSSSAGISSSATQLRSPRLCLQVHDELIFECPSNEEDLARMKVTVSSTH
jgi:hypothetical protein